MKSKKIFLLAMMVFAVLLMTGCLSHNSQNAMTKQSKNSLLTRISQIDSFRPEKACRQALQVINNNPYEQKFFEAVFATIVKQCKSSNSPQNADIIWNQFVRPLKKSGRVPANLVVTTWNYYFSSHFASLPDTGNIASYCHKLPEIKKHIEKEYRLKVDGFAATEQGSPDQHFVNAMYVYNTMWASCNPLGQKE